MKTKISMTREEAEAALQLALGLKEKHCEFSGCKVYEVEIEVEQPT